MGMHISLDNKLCLYVSLRILYIKIPSYFLGGFPQCRAGNLLFYIVYLFLQLRRKEAVPATASVSHQRYLQVVNIEENRQSLAVEEIFKYDIFSPLGLHRVHTIIQKTGFLYAQWVQMSRHLVCCQSYSCNYPITH